MKIIFLIIILIIFSADCFSQYDSASAALYKKYRKAGTAELIVGTTLLVGGSLSIAVAGFGYIITVITVGAVSGNPSYTDYSSFKTLAIVGLAAIGTSTIFLIEAHKKRKRASMQLYLSRQKAFNYKTFSPVSIPSVSISVAF